MQRVSPITYWTLLVGISLLVASPTGFADVEITDDEMIIRYTLTNGEKINYRYKSISAVLSDLLCSEDFKKKAILLDSLPEWPHPQKAIFAGNWLFADYEIDIDGMPKARICDFAAVSLD